MVWTVPSQFFWPPFNIPLGAYASNEQSLQVARANYFLGLCSCSDMSGKKVCQLRVKISAVGVISLQSTPRLPTTFLFTSHPLVGGMRMTTLGVVGTQLVGRGGGAVRCSISKSVSVRFCMPLRQPLWNLFSLCGSVSRITAIFSLQPRSHISDDPLLQRILFATDLPTAILPMIVLLMLQDCLQLRDGSLTNSESHHLLSTHRLCPFIPHMILAGKSKTAVDKILERKPKCTTFFFNCTVWLVSDFCTLFCKTSAQKWTKKTKKWMENGLTCPEMVTNA